MLLVNDLQVADFLTDIEECFKYGSYSDRQKKLIARHLRQLNFAECTSLIDDIAMVRTKIPSPLEIAEAVKAKIRERAKHEYVAEPLRDVTCRDCYETGLNFVNYESTKTLCKCKCDYGKKTISPFPLFGVFEGMRLLEFPYKEFQPKDKKIDSESAEQVVEWWNLQKQIATKFWERI